jgi:hypothetical protein
LLTAIGPDREGPVKGIQGAQDVEAALLDIVKYCPNVEYLDWQAVMLPMPSSIGIQLSRLKNIHSLRLLGEDLHYEDNFGDVYDCLKVLRRLSLTGISDIRRSGVEDAWISQDSCEPFGIIIQAATRSNRFPFLKFIYTSILTAAKRNLEEVEVEPEYIPILFTASLLPIFVGGGKVVLCLKWNKPLKYEWSKLKRKKCLEEGNRGVEAVDLFRERFADCKNGKEIASAAKDIYNNSNVEIIRGYAKLFAQNNSSLNERVLRLGNT